MSLTYPPRLIRLKDAPAYLAMDKNRFNEEVRPFLNEVTIGERGIAFDRLELDEWVDQYVQRNGSRNKGQKWDRKNPPDSTRNNRLVSGISTKSTEESDFDKAVKQITSKKPKNSLTN